MFILVLDLKPHRYKIKYKIPFLKRFLTKLYIKLMVFDWYFMNSYGQKASGLLTFQLIGLIVNSYM